MKPYGHANYITALYTNTSLTAPYIAATKNQILLFTEGSTYKDIDASCFTWDARHFEELPASIPSAGRMSFVNATGDEVSMEPLSEAIAYGGYYYSGDTALWSPGDVVRLTADGAEVPAFEVEIEFPKQVVPTIPNFESWQGEYLYVVNRKKDLEVHWEPTDGEVSARVVQFKESTYEGGGYVVMCKFPGQDGIGVIPREYLAPFEASDSLGSTTSRSYLVVGGHARVDTTAGDYDVLVIASHRNAMYVNIE